MPKVKPIIPLLLAIAAWAVVVWCCVALMGCAQKEPLPSIQDVKPVDVKPVKESVVVVKQYTNDARREIALAKREAEEARLDAEEAKALVAEMKAAESPYVDQVAELQMSYKMKITRLKEHIQETDRILAAQEAELLTTGNALEEAIVAAAVANQSNSLLIESNKKLKKMADDGAKYEAHWNTRWERKIKTIAWSVGGTVLGFLALFIWQRFSPSGLAASYAGSLLSRR